MMWETGNAFVIKEEATHCSYDNNTCYQALNVPVIFETSGNKGYNTGAMNLTVKGYGFESGNITATVDGVNCTITDFSQNAFSCEVQPKAEVSDPNITDHVGSNGMIRQFYQTETKGWFNWNDFNNMNASESLALTFSTPHGIANFYGTRMKGWFIPPATTNYRFYVACDDWCELKLNNATGVSEGDGLTKLVENYRASGHRNWW